MQILFLVILVLLVFFFLLACFVKHLIMMKIKPTKLKTKNPVQLSKLVEEDKLYQGTFKAR